MTSSKHPLPGSSPLVPVDDRFLKRLQVGDRLFYFSAPEDYTLYSVVDLPAEQEVVLLGAFDEAEKKKEAHACGAAERGMEVRAVIKK